MYCNTHSHLTVIYEGFFEGSNFHKCDARTAVQKLRNRKKLESIISLEAGCACEGFLGREEKLVYLKVSG